MNESSTVTSSQGGPSYVQSENEFKQVWALSLLVSIGTVASFFLYENLINWHGGVPLGYDSYYYVGFINQVVTSGPLQFAASQHYVEFLYPILASIPVYLGASADTVEIVLPAVMACSTVVAIGFLSLQTANWKVAILSVAFSGGWFAIYRMGAGFHGNLLALPLLILATAILIQTAHEGGFSKARLGIFLVLVVTAASAHVETTDFFALTWFLSFVLMGRLFDSNWGSDSLLAAVGCIVALPFTLVYVPAGSGVLSAIGTQYCVFPPYWLEVLGPAVAFELLGLGACLYRIRLREPGMHMTRVVASWSVIALVIGALGYLLQFPIVFSDRSLLLLPVPLIATEGIVWLSAQTSTLEYISQSKVLAILAVLIPLVTAPLVFSYVGFDFRYFAQHGPSLVTCSPQ
jgi:hypothetical protein